MSNLTASLAAAQTKAAETEASVGTRIRAEHQRARDHFRKEYERQLQNKLSKLGVQQSGNDEQIRALTEDLKSIRADREVKLEQLQDTVELLSKRDSRILEQDREIAHLRRETRKALSDTSSSTSPEASELKQKISDLKARVATLERDISAKEEEIRSTRARGDELSEKIVNLQRENRSLSDQVEKYRVEVREMGEQRRREQVEQEAAARSRASQRPPVPSRPASPSSSAASGSSLARQYEALGASSAVSGRNHSPTPADSVSQVAAAQRNPSDSLSVSMSTSRQSNPAASTRPAPSTTGNTSIQAGRDADRESGRRGSDASHRRSDDGDGSSDDDRRRRDRRSRDSGAHTRRRKSRSASGSDSDSRAKEAPSMTIPVVPTQASELRAWKNRVYRAVQACAKNGDKAWPWIKAVEAERSTLDDFAKSGSGFRRLDSKLCNALVTKLSSSSSLGQRVQQKDALWEDQHGLPLKGRQVLWVIFDYLSVSEQRRKVFGLKDLEGISYSGDSVSDMELFLNRWTEVLSAMEEKPSESQLRDIFLDQVRKSRTELSPFVRDYENADDGSSTKTYAFLMAGLEKRIRVKREAANRKSLADSISGRTPNPTPTPVAPGAEKGGKKGEGKGGRKGDPKSPRADAGKGQSGGDAPGLVATGICFQFARTGVCKKDPCGYVHRAFTPEEKKQDDAHLASRRASSPRPEKVKRPCRFFFSEGGCTHGDKCKSSHDPAVKAKFDAAAAEKAKNQ